MIYLINYVNGNVELEEREMEMEKEKEKPTIKEKPRNWAEIEKIVNKEMLLRKWNKKKGKMRKLACKSKQKAN